MLFVDEVRIFVKAGRGGDGVCNFRREKYIPHGGPDGGDGGNGGNVTVIAMRRLTTLLDLRYNQQYEAKPGGAGAKSHRHGRTAPDVTIKVPVGTIVYEDETGEILADLVTDGQACIVARGGRGGRGNSHFATPTNRVPTHFEHGQPGEVRWLRLELKLLADVGLVGFPNAGKSTLISAISSAHPKIADYPFTTLTPNLGVVPWKEDRTFVVADIPGLIEGAHEGKGLGLQFLRHIERTSFLLHLIDISEWAVEDPVASFEILRKELGSYDAALEAKPFAVVGTKLDVKGDEERLDRLRAYCKRHRLKLFPVSAATREGLEALVAFVGKHVESMRESCATTS
ncbi:MAG TPA: GTPase ObgE [Nitrospiraceae bacterium]|jgi:GTP-binding protein|nr:GTPase ObgE [Nitrospiraceae bacterium]